MPHKHEWQSRIKAVEREYNTVRRAVDHFQDAARLDPTLLQVDMRYGDVASASGKLEGTFIIRLFAEFETGARQYWATNWGTIPKTTDLLDGLAARRGIPDTQRENAHLVRKYRNSLVHEREEMTEEVPMDQSRSYLCHFFSFLPTVW